MALKLVCKNKKLPVIKGTDCKIGSYYRRESEPAKVYVCSRDTSLDRFNTVNKLAGPQLVYEGRMLVSLTHGNRMTANMYSKDFVEVDVVLEYKDAVS